MSFGIPPRRIRKVGELAKEVRIPSAELYYRLALELNNYKVAEVDLDAYYNSALSVSDDKNKLLMWYGISIGALYFSSVGVLKNFSIFGMEVDPVAIRYFLIMLIPVISILFAATFIKFNRYTELFQAVFNSSKPPIKQDLVLRYPQVFSFFFFNSWMTGAPNLMVPENNWPKRIVVILIGMIVGILFYIAFVIWLFGQNYMQIWESDPAGIGVWSRIIVFSSAAISVTGLCMPTLTIRRVVFQHFGLINTLEKFRNKDPDRYRHFVRLAFQAQKKWAWKSQIIQNEW